MSARKEVQLHYLLRPPAHFWFEQTLRPVYSLYTIFVPYLVSLLSFAHSRPHIPLIVSCAMAAIFKPAAARQAVRAASQVARPSIRAARPALKVNTRGLSTTSARFQDDEAKRRATTQAPPGASGTHEGAFARTDDSLVIEHPADEEMPRSPVVQGRGGMHFKRTLASFSLENRVSVVTGGARGLGLVMGQALVASGSDLAIVDLNSM